MVTVHSKFVAGASILALMGGVHARPAPQVISDPAPAASSAAQIAPSDPIPTNPLPTDPAPSQSARATFAPEPSGAVSDVAAARAANNAIAPMAPLFDYSNFTQSAVIPWSFGKKDKVRDAFGGASGYIQYKFGDNGAVHSGQVDTGSVGMLIAAGNIPGFQPDSTRKEAKMHYVPSDVFSLGERVVLDVIFPGAKAKAQVEVLAVTQQCVCKGCSEADGYSCNVTAGAKNVRKFPDLKGAPSMIGIGYARGLNLTAPISNVNPLMNIKEINGVAVGDNYNKGYILTQKGIQLGITADSAKGFEAGNMRLKELDNRGGDNQWSAARANVKWGTGPWISSGLLVDTGLGKMITNVPTNYPVDIPKNANTSVVDDGSPEMQVAIGPDPSNPLISYSFSVPRKSKNLNVFDADMTSPAAQALQLQPSVVVLHKKAAGFVNTGSRPLRAADMLYDAQNGYIAFRKVAKLGAAAAVADGSPTGTAAVAAPTGGAIESAPPAATGADTTTPAETDAPVPTEAAPSAAPEVPAPAGF